MEIDKLVFLGLFVFIVFKEQGYIFDKIELDKLEFNARERRDNDEIRTN